jgi:hypothetical protein
MRNKYSKTNRISFFNKPILKRRITTSPSFASFLNIPKPRSVNIFRPIIKRPAAVFWGDYDGDKVYNGFDCQPRNKYKQDKEDAELYLHDSHYGHLIKYEGFTSDEAKHQTDKEKAKTNVDAIIDHTLGKTYIQNFKGLSKEQISDVLTHEATHNTLYKNVSEEASIKFDNIAPKLEEEKEMDRKANKIIEQAIKEEKHRGYVRKYLEKKRKDPEFIEIQRESQKRYNDRPEIREAARLYQKYQSLEDPNWKEKQRLKMQRYRAKLKIKNKELFDTDE